ncbi:MAG: hypothetical protein LBO67_04845 [Spirochaetaceae bacterium]|jgi:hypothetical protein|nr:hypothetical protein [Spirochaetaceae bacterium]
MQDLDDLFKEYITYNLGMVHTTCPGVIVEYDSTTRRAKVKPSLKRKLGTGEYIDLPIINDVPVIFMGTKKLTIHFPLEENDEVVIFFSERSLEEWKSNGGSGIEDRDLRRFHLSDCYCIPGLQAIDFISSKEKGLHIIQKDVSEIVMAEEKTELSFGDTVFALLETDHVALKTEKCKVDLSGNKALLANSKSSLVLDDDKYIFSNSNKNLGTILDELLQALGTTNPATQGSPAAHTFNPAIIQAITKAQLDLKALLGE